MSYLESAPSILSIAKFCEEAKLSQIWTKNALCFGLGFQKSIAIFKISTLKFVKNKSLTHTVIFGIGSAFLKVWVRVRVRFIKYALKQGNVICVNENEAFKFKNLVIKTAKKKE